ncbi:MAG TPA: serine/threonine-protein kinase, partial [Thermoanaerobaculia bacterium]|nr:serine/threonine-protein kinase [Thermoanaerobaculia bacterium]
MQLAAGLKLGPYEVVSLVGMGGMGEVYRARDVRLGRAVAVKVLSTRFRADESRLKRFEQEARAVGSLAHPNILALHDIGTHEGAPFLVTELLEGETLAGRLKSGPLSVRKTIELGIAVAHGLAAAHEKGIVHRDLKPENVFLTTDGRVKILDFGLSKLAQPAGGGEHDPLAARDALTGVEMVVGTPGYMSPEQVRGGAIDQRSDVFALGVVLFEALTTRRAFQGESTVETMHLILSHEPTLSPQEEPGVPPVLARILAHCLEKSPEQRFQSARDLAFQLESLSSFSSPTASLPLPELSRRPSRAALAALFAALVVGAGAGALAMRAVGRASSRSGPLGLQRLTFRRGLIRGARFAPDGQSVVYGASWDGEPVRLFSARPGTPESRPLDVGDAELLDISKDGELAVLLGNGEKRYSARRSNRVLARVPLGGGAPREMMRDVLWAAWAPDGKTLAVVRDVAGKQRLELPAGTVRYETAGWITYPRVAADGSICFFDHPVRGDDRGDVALLDPEGKKKVLSTGWSSLKGLALAPRTGEVWYTAGSGGISRSLYATTLATGRTRPLAAMAGQLLVHDVSADGRALLTHDSYGASLNVLA